MFCRFCGYQIIHKIRFNDLIAADIYQPFSILMPEEKSTNDAFAVVVDLKNQFDLLDQHLDIKSHQVALIRGKDTDSN
jgi:hypothetical protein